MTKNYLSFFARMSALMFLAFFSASPLFAQNLLGQYTFDGALGSEVTFPVDSQMANITFTDMMRGDSVAPNLGGNTFNSSEWSLSGIDLNDYYSFTATPSTGFYLSLDSLQLDERRSAQGIREWSVRSSLDNFASDIAVFPIPDTVNFRTNQNIALGSAFDSLAGPVEFRIYGYMAEAIGGTWRIDNVELYGEAVSQTFVPQVSASFALNSVTLIEGDTVQVSVTIQNPTSSAITVQVQGQNITTLNSDHAFTPANITLSANSNSTQNIRFIASDDTVVESTETMQLHILSNGTPLDSILVTITDNDTLVVAAPAVSFLNSGQSISEVAGSVIVNLQIANPSLSDTSSVNVTLASGGTATQGSDFTFTTTQVNFLPGDSSFQSVTITINDDFLVEGSETINLMLTAVSPGVTVSSTVLTVTITDDDSTVVVQPMISFVQTALTLSESSGSTNLTVMLANGSATDTVMVTANVTGGTATSGTDYTLTNQTLTFLPGDSAMSISLAITDDQLIEGTETITLTLQNQSNGAMLGDSVITITLLDNDSTIISAPALATYTFTGAAGNEATFAADSQPANATFSPMSRGTGVTASTGANAFAATAWTTNTAPDLQDYFTFSITPDANFVLMLDSVVLDERRSNTGIRSWSVRSSLDNFTADLATFQVPDSNTTRVGQAIVLGSSFDLVTVPVEFRFYGYGSEATGGSWRLDNVSVYGTTAVGTGLIENATATALSVWPNPASNQLNVSLSGTEGAAQLSICNVLGQEVKHQIIAAGVLAAQVSVDNLPAGVYTARIQTASGIKTASFIKQ